MCCQLQARVECVIESDHDELDGMDCINPFFDDEQPFFEGEGITGESCPYDAVSVKITYEICNFDLHSFLILDQRRTQLMYDNQDITPVSIFFEPLEPEECVSYIRTATWDLCDVNGVGRRVIPFSVKVEGCLVTESYSYSSSSSSSSSSSKGGKSGKGSKSKGKKGKSWKGYGGKSGKGHNRGANCYCK